MDSGQALHGLIQHQQRDHEAVKSPAVIWLDFDLHARVRKQPHDGQRAEKFDQRRCDGLLRDIAQIASPQLLRAIAKPVGFDLLGAEGFHHLVSAQRFLQDLIHFRGIILRPAGGPANAPAELYGRNQHEGQNRQAGHRQPPIGVQNHGQ